MRSKPMATPNYDNAMLSGLGAERSEIGSISAVDKGLPAVAAGVKLPHLSSREI